MDSKYQLMMLAALFVSAVVSTIGMWRSSRPVLWFLIMATSFIMLAGFYFGKTGYFKDYLGNLDDNLPKLFQPTPSSYAWYAWVTFFALSVLYLTTWIVRSIYGSEEVVAENSTSTDIADLELTWEEIVSRMDTEDENWRSKPLFLVLSPFEDLTRSLLNYRELVVDRVIPDDLKAPMHAFGTPYSVFLSLADAGSYGSGGKGSKKRFAWVCKRLRELSETLPSVRGIVILVPYDSVRSGESLRDLGAVRSDLAAVAEIVGLDCPILLTYCFEADSTFHEYAERSKKAGLVGRIGFSYPESLRSEPEKIRPGFEWLAAVLGRSGMGLMCDDISNAEGNQKLLRFHWEMKRFSKDFGNGVVSALTRLSDRYIPMLSGCYFASLTDNGVGTFVIPLFKGEKCKVMTEKDRTTWSQAELMKARRYRLWSFGLLLGTILLLSPFWYLAICQRAFDSGHIAILAVLGIGWILVFLWKDRQRG